MLNPHARIDRPRMVIDEEEEYDNDARQVHLALPHSNRPTTKQSFMSYLDIERELISGILSPKPKSAQLHDGPADLKRREAPFEKERSRLHGNRDELPELRERQTCRPFPPSRHSPQLLAG